MAEVLWRDALAECSAFACEGLEGQLCSGGVLWRDALARCFDFIEGPEETSKRPARGQQEASRWPARGQQEASKRPGKCCHKVPFIKRS